MQHEALVPSVGSAAHHFSLFLFSSPFTTTHCSLQCAALRALRCDAMITVLQVNAHDWKLELERVGPRLKFKSTATASKEWRTHLEQSAKHEKSMVESFPETKAQLLKIGQALRKAGIRERDNTPHPPHPSISRSECIE